MKMSLLIPSSAAVLTDASDISEHDACDVSHINQTQTQTQTQNHMAIVTKYYMIVNVKFMNLMVFLVCILNKHLHY